MVGARAPACASYVGGWILAPMAEVRFPIPRSTTRSKGPWAPFPSPCQLPPAPPPASDHTAVALPAKLYHGRQQGTTHISGDAPPNCSVCMHQYARSYRAPRLTTFLTSRR